MTALLEVTSLRKTFGARRGLVGAGKSAAPAVHDVTFTIEAGRSLALVGESGAGKSTVGRLVLRLIEPDAGTILFDGVDVRALGSRDLRGLRRRMQMIFQDPFSALDPRMSIAEAVAEPLAIHHRLGRAERDRRAAALLDKVGIGPRYLERFPAELSGGQLQRVAIARALTVEPALIVCDEPVAALDVSVQAQVLNLMQELQDELGLSYLFITHDLALVEVIADRVAVMSAGTIVEEGPVSEVFANPGQEYTRELLSAIPIPVPRSARIATV